MGRIVSNFFISLDGVIEAPDQWHFPYFNDEMGAAVTDGVGSTSAFLMGRVLYEQWADYWPAQLRTEPEPAQETALDFAEFINRIPKYVVSSTLQEATWNNTTIISGDVAAGIQELKDRVDGNITMSGSATLVRWLFANGLLDELDLLVHPIVVGHGERLFEDTPTHRLTLIRHQVFSTGVLNLAYAPASD
jgi:dihydrofolate reductase